MSTLNCEVIQITARDGIALHTRVNRADQGRGTVLIHHGFAEYGQRYGHVVDPLVAAGWHVVTFDARGHGNSGGIPVFCKTFEEYVDDLARVVADVKARLPGPLVLLGHSMGGLVVLRLLVDQPRVCDAAVLSNPALVNKVVIPAWKSLLAIGASRLAPGLQVPSGIPPTDISRDPEQVKLYQEDPLVHKVATARWYTSFIGAQAQVLARAADLASVRILLLLGTGDRIIDSARTRAFYEQIPGNLHALQVYDGFYHELFNEPLADRQRVIADLCAWLQQLPVVA